MYTIYIIYSAALDRYYIGYTGELMTIRLKKHLAKHKGFTGKRVDWKVVYIEKYANKSDAIRREKEIKSWKSRIMIEQLIQKYGPSE
jgi:putative endonuclease